jgi:hypothetical protein
MALGSTQPLTNEYQELSKMHGKNVEINEYQEYFLGKDCLWVGLTSPHSYAIVLKYGTFNLL